MNLCLLSRCIPESPCSKSVYQKDDAEHDMSVEKKYAIQFMSAQKSYLIHHQIRGQRCLASFLEMYKLNMGAEEKVRRP